MPTRPPLAALLFSVTLLAAGCSAASDEPPVDYDGLYGAEGEPMTDGGLAPGAGGATTGMPPATGTPGFPPPSAGGTPSGGGTLPPPPVLPPPGAGGTTNPPPVNPGTGGTVDPGPVDPVPPPPGGGFIRGPQPTEQSAATKGPYAVQTYTSGMRDGPGYGSQTIHYPTGAQAPFASAVVVPGFVSPESSIQAWGPFLASHGIVTMTIGTNTGGDTPPVRSAALLDAIETLKAEQTRGGGQLAGQLDTTRFAVMGWSMGGGGALIAANGNPWLRAAISLCGWNPGATYPQNQVPSLMFAATADPLAGGQSQGFYTGTPETTSKLLYEIAGGNHNIANDPASESGRIGRYGLSWLKVFLEGDDRYRPFLTVNPPGTSDFRTNVR